VRILRRNYGKPGRSLRTIAAELGRTCQAASSKAALLGLNWPLEFRASANGTSKLSDHQQAEALRRLAAGESCRAIARTFEGTPLYHMKVGKVAAAVNRLWRTRRGRVYRAKPYGLYAGDEITLDAEV
jgi:hypothetical protein